MCSVLLHSIYALSALAQWKMLQCGYAGFAWAGKSPKALRYSVKMQFACKMVNWRAMIFTPDATFL
jgi:hypothetical protein